MSIDEIAASQGIRRKDAHNLFWGLYGYSLQFPIPPKWNEQRANRVMKFWATAKHVDAKEMRRIKPRLDEIHDAHKQRVNDLILSIIDANPHLDEGQFYYAANDPIGAKRSFITFYLREEEDAATMLTNMPNQFTLVTRPPSKAMHDMMVEVAGKKVVVREKGWFHYDKNAPEGGYTYKVELATDFYSEVSQKDIIHRVHNISFVDSIFSEGKSLYLYLNSEDDLFLAKIALSQFIKQITECIITDK